MKLLLPNDIPTKDLGLLIEYPLVDGLLLKIKSNEKQMIDGIGQTLSDAKQRLEQMDKVVALAAGHLVKHLSSPRMAIFDASGEPVSVTTVEKL